MGGHLLIMWATAEHPHPFFRVGSAENPARGKVKLEVWEFSGHCGFFKHFAMRLVKSTAVGAGGRLCSAVAWLARCAHSPALPPVISASLCPGTPSLSCHPTSVLCVHTLASWFCFRFHISVGAWGICISQADLSHSACPPMLLPVVRLHSLCG